MILCKNPKYKRYTLSNFFRQWGGCACGCGVLELEWINSKNVLECDVDNDGGFFLQIILFKKLLHIKVTLYNL